MINMKIFSKFLLKFVKILIPYCNKYYNYKIIPDNYFKLYNKEND